MGTTNTFWGLAVKPKKLFETEVEAPFRITKACLAPPFSKDGQVTSVYTKSTDTEEMIIANLNLNHCSVGLDLFFNPGEKICFRVSGSATVHLSGNIVRDVTRDDSEIGEEGESDEDMVEEAVENTKDRKRRTISNDNIESKRAKSSCESESEDGYKDENESMDGSESDDDAKDRKRRTITNDDIELKREKSSIESESDDGYRDENESMDDSESDDDSDSDDGDSDVGNMIEQNLKQCSSKITKLSNKPENSKTTNTVQKDTAKKETPKEKSRKEPPKAKSKKEPAPQQKPLKPKDKVDIVDIVTGTGEMCKKGNGVGVYYQGRLQANNKVFDSCRTGRPFKFKLGWGQVIKGWDQGVLGMRVGGKRRLVVPPGLAYGSVGAPPEIPGNATLVFDIECKFVKVYGGNQEW